MRNDHVMYPPAYGHAVVEDTQPQDAAVDPTVEKLFVMSNTASDRTASPIDMQSILITALSRLDEESDPFNSHAVMPTTTATPDDSADATETVADLLARARSGDSAAWEKIVRRYSSVVCATARSFRLQDADVLDAVQMTWLRLAEYGHRVQDPERLAGWLP